MATTLPRLGYLAGVVPKVDEARFARALWRAARGNTFAWPGGTGRDGMGWAMGFWREIYMSQIYGKWLF